MNDLYWLTEAQMGRLSLYFPKRRQTTVDDRRVLGRIIFVNRNEPSRDCRRPCFLD